MRTSKTVFSGRPTKKQLQARAMKFFVLGATAPMEELEKFMRMIPRGSVARMMIKQGMFGRLYSMGPKKLSEIIKYNHGGNA